MSGKADQYLVIFKDDDHMVFANVRANDASSLQPTPVALTSGVPAHATFVETHSMGSLDPGDGLVAGAADVEGRQGAL